MPNNPKFVEEARDYINSALPMFLWNAGWQKPGPGDLKALRDLVSERDIDSFVEEAGFDDEFGDWLRAFVDGDKKAAKDAVNIETLVHHFRTNALSDALDIREKRVVSVQMATGGPGFDVEFELDSDGDLECARAIYRNWGRHEEVLPDRIAEDLWERFESMGYGESPESRMRY